MNWDGWFLLGNFAGMNLLRLVYDNYLAGPLSPKK